MNNETARYEIKYILDERSYAFCRNWLYSKTILKKKHPQRTVNSIYCDNISYDSAADNIIGLPYRSKYRFRWYGGLMDKPNCVTFEKKIKNNRVNTKNSLKLNVFNLDQNKNSSSFLDSAIKEVEYKMNQGKLLIPSLGVTYERDYFEDLNGLRVTFDRNIKFFPPKKLIKPDINFVSHKGYIMEVKFPIKIKNYAQKAIKDIPISPSRHSKYLMGLSKIDGLLYI